MLEAGGEHDLATHKRVIMDWTREIKSRPQVSAGWRTFWWRPGAWLLIKAWPTCLLASDKDDYAKTLPLIIISSCLEPNWTLQWSNTNHVLCFPTHSIQPTVWPGEPVLMMLDDLEFQWKRGRLPSLLPAMELIMLAVLNADSPVKVCHSVCLIRLSCTKVCFLHLNWSPVFKMSSMLIRFHSRIENMISWHEAFDWVVWTVRLIMYTYSMCCLTPC